MKRGFGVCLLVFVVLLIAVNKSQIAAEGGYFRTLLWSADSSQLLIETDCVVGPDELPGIYLLKVQDGQIIEGTQLADNEYWLGSSPDLLALQDTAFASSVGDIYEFNFETGSLHNLTPNIPYIDRYQLIADNSTLLLLSSKDRSYPIHYDGVYAIYRTRDNETRDLTPNISRIADYRLYPNDETLLILTENGEFYRINVLTGEAIKLAEDDRLTRASWEASNGDATYFYFWEEQQYLSLNIQSGDLQPAETYPPLTRAAPDGMEVYLSGNDLYTLNPATNETRLIWEDFPGSLSDFELFFVDNYIISRSAAGAFALNIASGEIHDLAADFPEDTRIWATWIPSLRALVVLTTEREIYTVSLTGEIHHLSSNIAPVRNFDVSPNGTHLVFWDDELNVTFSSIEGEVVGSINGATFLGGQWLEDNLLILQAYVEPIAAQPGWHTAGALSTYVIPPYMAFRAIPSPDGRLIAFEDCNAAFGIHLVSLDDAPNN